MCEICSASSMQRMVIRSVNDVCCGVCVWVGVLQVLEMMVDEAASRKGNSSGSNSDTSSQEFVELSGFLAVFTHIKRPSQTQLHPLPQHAHAHAQPHPPPSRGGTGNQTPSPRPSNAESRTTTSRHSPVAISPTAPEYKHLHS